METKLSIQVADPEVSKNKFEAEINRYNDIERSYRAKGIICTKVSFPDIFLIFAIPKAKTPIIAFSVKINFTNYDYEPPSVVFLNPFTEELVRRDQVPIGFLQVNKSNPFQPVDLLQGGGNMIPFFCIPGVREYHNHPAHSGDSWFLYRTRGEGTLLFIIDQLYNYSVGTAREYLAIFKLTEMNLQVQQELKMNQ